MKKFLKSLMFAALGLFALSSCEDVPAPYDIPGAGQGGVTPGEKEEATGSGTLADPWNVTAANEACSALQQSSTSETFLSDEVYVKGVISQIDNVDPSYGNATYYISNDGTSTNQLEVYRGYYLDGAKFTSADQIAVGDTVIVCGKLQNWLGKVNEFTTGSKIVYHNGNSADVPSGERAEPAGAGTESDPYNVSAVLKLYEDNAVPSGEVYVRGKISDIRSLDTSKYTRAQYYISDDGTTAYQFYVYNGLYLGGENFTSDDQLKVGDEVVVYGTLTSYNGTNEFAANNKIVELNGQKAEDNPTPEPTGTPEGDGTEANPWNVAAVTQAYAANNNFYDADKVYYVKGIVTNVATFSDKYGSLSYYIADEANGTNTFYVYSGLGLEQSKFSSKNDLKAGDEVVVCGKFTVYNGTFEFQYNNYLVSLNGVTDPGDLPDTPDTPDNPDVSGNSITFSALGYDNAQSVDGQTITVGDATLTFSVGSGKNAPAYYNTGNALRMYGGNTLTINSSKTISKVEFKYGDDYNGTSYYPTADNSTVEPGNYDYSTHVWTGSAKQIVLTRTATTGHFRFETITISYAE